MFEKNHEKLPFFHKKPVNDWNSLVAIATDEPAVWKKFKRYKKMDIGKISNASLVVCLSEYLLF